MDLLNKIIYLDAEEFFKRVLRKRTNFIGFTKGYEDVLIAKNRPMNKTLTMMDEVDEEKEMEYMNEINDLNDLNDMYEIDEMSEMKGT